MNREEQLQQVCWEMAHRLHSKPCPLCVPPIILRGVDEKPEEISRDEAKRRLLSIRQSFEAHKAKATEYERGGNVEGAMYLRYVVNLLWATYDGSYKGGTILP